MIFKISALKLKQQRVKLGKTYYSSNVYVKDSML